MAGPTSSNAPAARGLFFTSLPDGLTAAISGGTQALMHALDTHIVARPAGIPTGGMQDDSAR